MLITVIKITSIAGNIFHDKRSPKTDDAEYLWISRPDLEKSRFRAKTDKGTDIGLDLESDNNLQNGDMLSCDGKIIVVKQLPEKLISVKLGDNKTSTDVLVLAGHIVGNRHRPISVIDDCIYFPIQHDSELDVFKELFSGISNHVELSITKLVFEPLVGANVHGH